MTRFLRVFAKGRVDHLTGIFLAASPWLLGFKEQSMVPEFAVGGRDGRAARRLAKLVGRNFPKEAAFHRCVTRHDRAEAHSENNPTK
jgi:hypothetical protein